MLQKDFNYPVMLNLSGKKCVVVGAGATAARKIATLRCAGADVTIVAPSFSEDFKGCTPIKDVYRKEYLEGAFVTVAATDSAAVNRTISSDAPLLVNNVSEPDYSNFIVPASFTAGKIKVAITTGMPAYSRVLKNLIYGKLKIDFAAFNDILIEERKKVRKILPNHRVRVAFWREALNEDLVKLLEEGNIDLAKDKITDAVNSIRTKP
ncbi:MAG: bifunctional precorrin-2 dehydrogenase/sirohydrochlorin ferrochelatase [Phascolarctobacterium sp.]|nr:bifunctional precorrin-2 dehydrogenase/sirohydrochlorin ferrochelatase [Phascolarctobacterium sp.]